MAWGPPAPGRVSPATVRGVALVLLALAAPRGAQAIPVFARIYDKPCSACHTVYPQLNPDGERFRAQGLHGLTPAFKPLHVAPELELPGTVPVALAMSAGGDFIGAEVPNASVPTSKRFNFEFLSVLVGAELGPHVAFLGDYAPIFMNPRTGETIVNTRAGIAFLQLHGDYRDWLGNVRGGLFELPLGTSPRVHRLSVQGYLTYGVNAFSLLGRPPPEPREEGGYAGAGVPAETLSLGSTQLGVELSGLNERNGLSLDFGTVGGSNNREDQNDAQDLFIRVGKAFGYHQTGFFLYYSPDLLKHRAPTDSGLRFGPDGQLYFRTLQLTGQILVGRDGNPTDRQVPLWWVGGFVEADHRLLSRIMSLVRVEWVGMPTYDDRGHGGTAHVRRDVFETTAGLQWLFQQNVKLQLEGTYDRNHEGVSGVTVESWSATVRVATAFWPFSPPPASRWLSEAGFR